MSLRVLLLTAALPLTLTACTVVYSLQPVGEEPLVLDAEEWEGTWNKGEDFLKIRVVDSQAGRLEAAWIETTEEGFELERVEVLVRKSGDVIFGNAFEEPDEEEEKKVADPWYLFFRIGRGGEQLTLWYPNVKGFKAFVRGGRLPGTVTEGGDVDLSPGTGPVELREAHHIRQPVLRTGQAADSPRNYVDVPRCSVVARRQ